MKKDLQKNEKLISTKFEVKGIPATGFYDFRISYLAENQKTNKKRFKYEQTVTFEKIHEYEKKQKLKMELMEKDGSVER
ncbi:hypothetical protein [Listeria aquatica]|uniref:Uncharacterized protein n=1 Tax=Listeria aquatica FSL S10-1188 TaxID=1265818 RepID=W7B9N0_9LIST|nr:hypothetical protein [Listeria aquatica]EUJ16608.1 hypothetical protein MAQA_15766 [Listeria aquatica FSL S10-1188]